MHILPLFRIPGYSQSGPEKEINQITKMSEERRETFEKESTDEWIQ
jgi:hypothetical protein